MESDGELVLAALAGDRDAFAVLIDRHSGGARAAVERLLRSSTEAEDVLQEALLQAYLGLERLRNPERFGSWLRAIATNLARMRLREGRMRVVPLERVDFARLRADDGVGVERALERQERLDALRGALAELSRPEREALLFHHVAGLTANEIAARAGERTGTVRVRLHRARRRLRRPLATFAPTTRKPEVKAMIEVRLRDVLVRVAPAGEGPVELASPHRIVLLEEKAGRRLLPIWVGAPEGDALALQLGGETMPRPLTVDLMARLLDASGVQVERVLVSALREKTFYAVVTIANGNEREVDARPSDALNLAARVGAPMFVDEQIFAEAGIAADDHEALECELDSVHEELTAEAPPGEWRSLSPELVKALRPERPR